MFSGDGHVGKEVRVSPAVIYSVKKHSKYGCIAFSYPRDISSYILLFIFLGDPSSTHSALTQSELDQFKDLFLCFLKTLTLCGYICWTLQPMDMDVGLLKTANVMVYGDM